jgi:hypothetical protein
MDRHHADIQGRRRPPVAPPLHDHPTQHLLATGVQAGEEDIHAWLAPVQTLLAGVLWGGQLVEKFGIKGGWTTQLAVAMQEPPLLHRHANVPAQVLVLLVGGRGVVGQLFFQPGQPRPQF